MHREYPLIISPQKGYRRRLPMRILLRDYPELAVVRRCNEKDPFAYSGTGKIKILRTEVLGEKLRELSVNLLGGRFKIRHLPFGAKGELVENEWDGKSFCKFPLDKGICYKKELYDAIYFRVAQVNSFAFPYTKSIEKEGDYAVIKNKAKQIKEREKLDVVGELIGVFGGKKNMTDVQARLHVNHHPNLLNYWHMQIDVYPIGSDEYLLYDDGSKEAKRINQQMKKHIARIAIRKLDSVYRISRRYYMHDTSPFLNCIAEFRRRVVTKSRA